ncbi:hypothetical protein CP533_2837 [Ophiocordyceps camponoti-saundersi (nom. inval.)]|nr:hypothetical protein CP533_2837 [Ophiocordyceps camponoti-saundersi (nom. inval.)]
MLSQRVGLSALRSRDVESPVATTKVAPEQGQQILARQRLNRPVSPHLGIYKLEQTWFGASAWTRITGCTLSGAAYVYFASYLVAPLVGLHLESASLAAAFASWPLFAKGAVKFVLGFPFTFHFLNGIKHLVYDMGIGFAKSSIKQGEMLLWITSVLGGLALAFGI